MEAGLEAVNYYDPPNLTFPFGSYICVVDIDRGTGMVKIRRFVAVDDCGNIINPMIVDGQIHGGLTMGMAPALLEEISYDENGNNQAGSFMDYLVPTAVESPSWETYKTVTPSPHHPLGSEGRGRVGDRGGPAGDRERSGGRARAPRGEARGHPDHAREGVAPPQGEGSRRVAMTTAFQLSHPCAAAGVGVLRGTGCSQRARLGLVAPDRGSGAPWASALGAGADVDHDDGGDDGSSRGPHPRPGGAGGERRAVAGGGERGHSARGYLGVWALASVALAMLDARLGAWGLMTHDMASRSVALNVIILGAAGLAQLSPWKSACLERCRSFPARAAGRRGPPAGSGVRHGVASVSSCGVLMLVLLVVGAMNWMAMPLLTALLVAERLAPAASRRY
jgi:hypothetical protein